MPFALKLAWKYLRARRRSLARLTAVAAVVGIAAGVASLIVALALSGGFAGEMRDKILANTAHVSVFTSDGAEIENWERIKPSLEKLENVETVAATSFESVFVIGRETTSYAVLKRTPGLEDRLPKPQKIEVALGEKLAEKLNVRVGEEIELVVLGDDGEPRRVSVVAGEVFQTGLYEYDASWIRISPENYAFVHARRAVDPTHLDVSVRDIYRSRETAGEIRKLLGENFKVLDWQEANEPLFAALSLERKVSLAIISLIIFIAALNITTTLALLVNERRLDIAVLRACGARTRSLMSIFLFEGLLLGLFGVAAGVAGGLLACFLGNYFRLVSLSAEVYSLNYIPLRPTAAAVALTAAIALCLTAAASVYPALKASRIKPLENLRTQ